MLHELRIALKIASSRRATLGAPASLPPRRLACPEVGVRPRRHHHFAVNLREPREGKRKRGGATDDLASRIVLRAVTRAHVLVGGAIPRHDASEVRADGVYRVQLQASIFLDDEVVGVALQTLHQRAIRVGVLPCPHGRVHVVSLGILCGEAGAGPPGGGGHEKVDEATCHPRDRHADAAEKDSIHYGATLHVGDEGLWRGGSRRRRAGRQCRGCGAKREEPGHPVVSSTKHIFSVELPVGVDARTYQGWRISNRRHGAVGRSQRTERRSRRTFGRRGLIVHWQPMRMQAPPQGLVFREAVRAEHRRRRQAHHELPKLIRTRSLHGDSRVHWMPRHEALIKICHGLPRSSGLAGRHAIPCSQAYKYDQGSHKKSSLLRASLIKTSLAWLAFASKCCCRSMLSIHVSFLVTTHSE